ncbi:MAG: AEC family transporter [Anaerolineae bacterium]|nr:AEC family transporter [Anaerolineae bacterium]
MSSFFEVAYNLILPIFLVAGASAWLDRRFAPDPRALSRVVIYLFTPCLALDRIANSDLTASEAGQLIAVAGTMSILIVLLAWGAAGVIGLDRKVGSAFVLCAVLINAGNYGLPLSRFAYGAAGEERALVFFMGTVVLSNTLGIYLASLGSVSARQAVINVATVPLPYAVLVGFILNAGNITMPVPIQRSVGLLGQAANPAMLVVLGIQLSRASFKSQVKPVLLASGMRLVIGPLIAVGLTALLGVEGVTRQVAITLSGMPTAVISGVLATEFGGDAEFVTTGILTSTLLSIVTLSVVLSLLT